MRIKAPVLLILVVAIVLRVVGLASFPNGFTPDEASFAYDAYSILHTGKDQWGHVLPLVLESFGDFKAPLYTYLALPFIGVIGLTKTAIRLPNALVGVASVWVVYLLCVELIRRDKRLTKFKDTLPVIASFLLAISPWHVLLSRGAFEANLTTFLMPLGLLLFVKGLEKQRLLFWSEVVFGLNLFSYHSSRVVAPVLVVFLVYRYLPQIKKLSRKVVAKTAIIFLAFTLLAALTFFQGAGARAADISIFGGAGEAQAADRLAAIESGVNPNLARLVHNKYRIIATRFVANYTQYFSPKFLFTKGAGEATYGMFPGRGVLYSIEVVAIVAFVVFSVNNWRSRTIQVLLVWILLAPIPAALAAGVGYAANRTAIIMPAIQIASGIGVAVVINFIVTRTNWGSGFVTRTVIAIFCLFVVDYTRFYFSHYFEAVKGEAMLNGNLEAAQWVVANTQGSVFVSKRLSEPHIYFAFAGLIDPKVYQSTSATWDYEAVGRKFVDQLGTYTLDRYVFSGVHSLELPNDFGYAVGFADELVGYGEVVYESGSSDRKVVVVKL